RHARPVEVAGGEIVDHAHKSDADNSNSNHCHNSRSLLLLRFDMDSTGLVNSGRFLSFSDHCSRQFFSPRAAAFCLGSEGNAGLFAGYYASSWRFWPLELRRLSSPPRPRPALLLRLNVGLSRAHLLRQRLRALHRRPVWMVPEGVLLLQRRTEQPPANALDVLPQLVPRRRSLPLASAG